MHEQMVAVRRRLRLIASFLLSITSIAAAFGSGSRQADFHLQACASFCKHAAAAVVSGSFVAGFGMAAMALPLGPVEPAEAVAPLTAPAFVGGKQLAACPSDTNCVSSNFREAPNRYVSPLQTVNDREEAFRRAVRDIERSSPEEYKIVEVSPKEYYIHLRVAGTAPDSQDDIELVVLGTASEGGGIVNLRCQAQVTLPPPPFCIKTNCINGNMDQRERIQRLSQQVLGLPPVDQSRMQAEAKWTPIFFNSDRVPDMVDDE